MRVVVLYTPAAPDAPPQELDGLAQRDAVSQALQELGHDVRAVPLSLDLASTRDQIARLAPDCVFNLVESVGGRDRLIHLAPALLEAMELAFTGASEAATILTTCKPLAKRLLRAHGAPTPDWWPEPGAPDPRGAVVLKSAWDHGSVGLDEEAVAQVASPEELAGRLRGLAAARRCQVFAERYIEGREFNLSLLAGPDGPRVLPPAEIRFLDYAQGKPRVVGYRAKWQADSFEYSHTPRTFEFPQSDGPLLARLADLALRCWDVFGLRGYARVDFRVDEQGGPWILEVNVNPCLTPDAGFAAAVDRGRLSYAQAVERILADAFRPVA